jgi:iron(III) transport system substrate-binding protein
VISTALTPSLSAAVSKGEVNIYSTRQEVLIRPLLDAFAKETGIRVNVVFLRDGLLERLRAEGAASPADAVLVADVSNLVHLDRAGLLQPIASETLKTAIPAQYRDPAGKWFGLAIRARPIVYNPAKVKAGELSTYEALADAKWKGRICVRSSGHPYNLALLSSIIAATGSEKAQSWAKGFAANLARPPAGGDRDQIQAVAAGVCDIAIVNTYYLAGMLSGKDVKEKSVAETLRVFWPNQNGRGTHVNISGAAVTKAAKNKDNAVRLLEFLAGENAQRIYAEQVLEYPVRPGVPASTLLRSFGEFKADPLPLVKLAEQTEEALKIADRAGWR